MILLRVSFKVLRLYCQQIKFLKLKTIIAQLKTIVNLILFYGVQCETRAYESPTQVFLQSGRDLFQRKELNYCLINVLDCYVQDIPCSIPTSSLLCTYLFGLYMDQSYYIMNDTQKIFLQQIESNRNYKLQEQLSPLFYNIYIYIYIEHQSILVDLILE